MIKVVLAMVDELTDVSNAAMCGLGACKDASSDFIHSDIRINLQTVRAAGILIRS